MDSNLSIAPGRALCMRASLVALAIGLACCSHSGSAGDSGTPGGNGGATGYTACYNQFFRQYLSSCSTDDDCGGGALTCDVQGTGGSPRCHSVGCSQDKDCVDRLGMLCAQSDSDPFHFECVAPNSLAPTDCQLVNGATPMGLNDVSGTWSGTWSDPSGDNPNLGTGGLTLTLSQNGSSVTGTATFGSLPCFASGTIASTHTAGDMHLGGTLTAGAITLQIDADLDRTGTNINGYFSGNAGSCGPRDFKFTVTK